MVIFYDHNCTHKSENLLFFSLTFIKQHYLSLYIYFILYTPQFSLVLLDILHVASSLSKAILLRTRRRRQRLLLLPHYLHINDRTIRTCSAQFDHIFSIYIINNYLVSYTTAAFNALRIRDVYTFCVTSRLYWNLDQSNKIYKLY